MVLENKIDYVYSGRKADLPPFAKGFETRSQRMPRTIKDVKEDIREDSKLITKLKDKFNVDRYNSQRFLNFLSKEYNEEIKSIRDDSSVANEDLMVYINVNSNTYQAGFASSVLVARAERKTTDVLNRKNVDLEELENTVGQRTSPLRNLAKMADIAGNEKYGFLGTRLPEAYGLSKNQGMFATIEGDASFNSGDALFGAIVKGDASFNSDRVLNGGTVNKRAFGNGKDVLAYGAVGQRDWQQIFKYNKPEIGVQMRRNPHYW